MKNVLSAILTILAFSLLSVSCGVDKQRARFEGKIANINNAEFYIYCEDGSFEGVDTIRIVDGEFVYERKALQPMLATLLYPNYTQTYVILEPGKKVKMKGDASKLGEASVTGSEQNELLTNFRQAHVNSNRKTALLAAEEFVQSHAQSLAAVAIFRRYFTDEKNVNSETAVRLLDLLSKAQPQSRTIQYLEDFYRPVLLNSVGRQWPEFKVETIDNKTITNADYKGKNVAIACVGLWHNDSHRFLIELSRRLKKSKKDWKCMIVSMDFDDRKVEKYTEIDSLKCDVICDQMAFESPFVRLFGLHYVPSLMIVNDEGRIVQRDVMKIDEAKID